MSPKDFPCPNCGAKAGGWCKRPSGHSGPFVAFHAARVKLAEAADEAGESEEEDEPEEATDGVSRSVAEGDEVDDRIGAAFDAGDLDRDGAAHEALKWLNEHRDWGMLSLTIREVLDTLSPSDLEYEATRLADTPDFDPHEAIGRFFGVGALAWLALNRKPKRETVKRLDLFGNVADTFKTEAELNGWRPRQGALL